MYIEAILPRVYSTYQHLNRTYPSLCDNRTSSSVNYVLYIVLLYLNKHETSDF